VKNGTEYVKVTNLENGDRLTPDYIEKNEKVWASIIVTHNLTLDADHVIGNTFVMNQFRKPEVIVIGTLPAGVVQESEYGDAGIELHVECRWDSLEDGYQCAARGVASILDPDCTFERYKK
jgi:hypothetical protein